MKRLASIRNIATMFGYRRRAVTIVLIDILTGGSSVRRYGNLVKFDKRVLLGMSFLRISSILTGDLNIKIEV